MVLGGVIAAVLVALLDGLAGVDEGAVVATPDSDLGPLTSGSFPTAIGLGDARRRADRRERRG